LEAAAAVVDLLPPEHAGEAVLTPAGELYRAGPQELSETLTQGGLQFHAGRIGGALPRIVR
jgi:hypothetical protein